MITIIIMKRRNSLLSGILLLLTPCEGIMLLFSVCETQEDLASIMLFGSSKNVTKYRSKNETITCSCRTAN